MRAAVTRTAEIARANDTLVSYDTNLRLSLWSLDQAKTTIDAFMPLADVVFPSDNEAEMLTGISGPLALIQHYQSCGAKIVVLKRGAEGAILEEGNGPVSVSPEASDPVDSACAGDSFDGAFLTYFLETGDAAIRTVSGYGAIAPVPHRSDIESLF